MFPVLVSGFILAFVSGLCLLLWCLLFWFLFLFCSSCSEGCPGAYFFSLFSLFGMPFSCFSCSFGWLGAYFFLTFLFLVCLLLAFHTLLDAPGHTFPFFSFSGMPFACFSCSFKRPGAYFFLFFHFWYVYLAVFETYAKMIDARHLTELSLDWIFYQADCA